MPKIKSKDEPEGIRPYLFHGVDLQYGRGDDNAIAECPFCGRDNKFAVEIDTSKFRCFVCDETGNSLSFLQKFWNLCYQETSATDYKKLAIDSGFVSPESANVFGLAKSLLTDEWLVPGFNAVSQLTGLYRYAHFPSEKKYRLLPTPGAGHHMFNVHNYEDDKPIVDLCEGWRDGILWMETGAIHDTTDRNIIAIAGTNSFKPAWHKLFSKKVVNIMFDNDHPRTHPQTGAEIEPAGLKGAKRVASILTSSGDPPSEINLVHWEGAAEGYSLNLDSGTDIRDFIQG